eukprot:CAMPEP_0198734278 /NCGR_PEP_ID=MMETSP1475-20131203/51536_1 /TAXON_ID= ORGANISM="Unidentified sp., Strain CCMP1999" /NCGR_SAMPLE_ID=MMETSP1475 /ASSEMBLY_ACC=CAM_ASM_001111 /LENGTH=138 /DNA_ID=CAMNT_0044497715 /DNA_START=125 /DNA_END=537 /DNA_ORIENTATION=-
MLEGLISDVLERVLGQYIHGISRDTISVGLWGGTLELRSLKMRSEAISMLLLSALNKDAPFVVEDGSVDSVHLEVPWQQLRSSPIKVVLRGLNAAVVVNTKVDAAALRERSKTAKKLKLDADDAFRAVATREANTKKT